MIGYDMRYDVIRYDTMSYIISYHISYRNDVI